MKTECGCVVTFKESHPDAWFVQHCERHSEQNVAQLEARVVELEGAFSGSRLETLDLQAQLIPELQATISRLTAERDALAKICNDNGWTRGHVSLDSEAMRAVLARAATQARQDSEYNERSRLSNRPTGNRS